MEYLKRVLGIETTYENGDLKGFPNFIGVRYDLRPVLLDGKKAVFVYPKTQLEPVETLKKHLTRIKNGTNLPVVLVLEQITSRQKEYLIRSYFCCILFITVRENCLQVRQQKT